MVNARIACLQLAQWRRQSIAKCSKAALRTSKTGLKKALIFDLQIRFFTFLGFQMLYLGFDVWTGIENL